jgi:alpha-beta hydrolase superfamily lysophospholipase
MYLRMWQNPAQPLGSIDSPMPNPLRWCVRRRRWIAAAGALAFLVLNVVAFMHARAFTHYATGGTRTEAVNRIGWWDKAKVLLTGITLPRPENTLTPADLGLPFTTHTISEGNVTLEAWHVPAEESRGLVLLFHGHGGCKCALIREAVVFHELGYSSLLVDFRGSGGSSESISTIGVLEADDVSAAVGFARDRWPGQRIALFGQSMGAAAILRATAAGTAADAIMLECPFDRMLTTAEHRFELMGVPAFPFARLLLFWGGVQNGFNAFTHNPVEFAVKVRCPVLLMHGAQDPLVHVNEAESIYAALPGPKRWELFADAGHLSYCFKCPDRWTVVVREFLREHLKSQ